MNDQAILFDAELIQRYDIAGPRYTSYPTALQFHSGFDEQSYRTAAAESQGPLSLYFHLPFCDTVCFYCACNKVVTKDRSRAQPYLDRLYRELALQSELFAADRVVEQLHWGGGTPTFISHEQMSQLMEVTAEQFRLRDDDGGEYSIEIDPREVTPESIALLRQLGFNRMSFGVQDFDPRVQRAVNRIQSREQTEMAVQAAREANFKSISVDLIYGLPHQDRSSFRATLRTLLELDPDRISVFNYAHLPERFKPQRRISADDLPTAREKLAILQSTIEFLTDAGYRYIGMDHFAKPEDELARAQDEGSLYRNFQGYSTHADCDLIALGITAIGKVGGSYSQNQKELDPYYADIDAGRLPLLRGVELNADDRLRRAVINELICHFRLDFRRIEGLYSIAFADYFAAALERLQPMIDDQLVEIDEREIRVLPRGRLLLRNVCMPFDRYLDPQQSTRFSKVI